jgi:pimeloyl-ACP methyl ester carboxylesterase
MRNIEMNTVESIFIVAGALLVIMVVGNVTFSFLAERRNPPIGEFLECDGVRLHYIERGNPAAPCVVLFHGNGSMMQDFIICGLVDLLARENRVICFDRPGFGHSQRPRLHTWTATAQAALFAKALNQLGVRDPVLLGHSWGTLVAIGVSMRDDYPIRGLVLASGYYFPSARWDVWLMSGPAIPILGDLIRYTVAPIISWAILPSAFRKLFSPRSVPLEFKNELPRSLMLRPKQLRAAAEESALLVPTAVQFRSLYESIRRPVRIFHGAEDAIIESKQARDLQRAIGGPSGLFLIKHAGHMVTYADTAAIAEAVNSLGNRNRFRTLATGS